MPKPNQRKEIYEDNTDSFVILKIILNKMLDTLAKYFYK